MHREGRSADLVQVGAGRQIIASAPGIVCIWPVVVDTYPEKDLNDNPRSGMRECCSPRGARIAMNALVPVLPFASCSRTPRGSRRSPSNQPPIDMSRRNDRDKGLLKQPSTGARFLR